ncbi:hypothetical protein Ari01nite_97580 [Paractinoplanes rishiriensis]|uniref:Uncharacterized protein n=1 Tax=Paractinoplanes rishiriensis TaxID=1050105 RepID=A0A919N030_9ACTN|nr:hypothetical protein Ari01nite_97580 [Actinoplanes rishiriensis]
MVRVAGLLGAEREWLARRDLDGKPEDHPDEIWELDANEVAAAISMDVGWHHPVTTDVTGLPVLASAPGTDSAKLPAGIYEI